ncbi:MAG TPA: PilZ domain-containing protein [Steroidobacteraceae bacterium]
MEGLRVCPYRFSVATTYRLPTLTSRREFFRLPYPVTTGATLAVEGANYKVGEVSERGLRIVSDVDKFPLESAIHGTLILTMGLRCTVAGKVLRVEDGAVVVKLDRGPTTYDVIREQRHLTKTFPDWKPLPA